MPEQPSVVGVRPPAAVIALDGQIGHGLQDGHQLVAVVGLKGDGLELMEADGKVGGVEVVGTVPTDGPVVPPLERDTVEKGQAVNQASVMATALLVVAAAAEKRLPILKKDIFCNTIISFQ